jgi:hypothetical protein
MPRCTCELIALRRPQPGLAANCLFTAAPIPGSESADSVWHDP